MKRNNDFRYWAFISYSHHDKRVARWLKRELSKQDVPRHLRDKVSEPSSRLEAVFLDEESGAASNSLTTELETALRKSRTLLVVCSPFSATSSFVDAEIRFFQSLGREHRIVCVVASGVPNASDEGIPHLECFPAPLRLRVTSQGSTEVIPKEQRPLAAVLGHETETERKRVLQQVTAGLLGMSRSDYENYRRWHVAGRVAIIALLGVAIWAMLWAFVIPSDTYSKSYVRRWGIWEEVDQVNRAQSSKMSQVYEFTRQGAWGKPLRVKLLNGFGQCPYPGIANILNQTSTDACNKARACEVQFDYSAQGEIIQEKQIDQFGQILETLSYTTPQVALFTEAGFGCSRSHSGIKYVQFQRGQDGPQRGLDERILFFGEDKERTPRMNAEGAFGKQITYDDKGRIVKEFMLSPEGHPQMGVQGYAGFRAVYNAAGDRTETEFIDRMGNPTPTLNAYARILWAFDPFGNRVQYSTLGQDGRPVLNNEAVAIRRISRGEHGEALQSEDFDISGTPTLNTSAWAKARYIYDDNGKNVTTLFFDKQGEPTITAEGIAGMRLVYDKWGNIIERIHLDVNGMAFLPSNKGYAIMQTRYDMRGNTIEQVYLDEHRNIIRGKDGVAREQFIYNEKNKKVAIEYFGPDGKPTLLDGIAGQRYSYDENGNLTGTTNVGIDEQPTVENNGTAEMEYKYDANGREVEIRAFGLDRKPWVHGGHSVKRVQYNILGQPILESYHNTDGGLVPRSSGNAMTKFQYDGRGRVLEESYLGPKMNPIRDEHGCAGLRYEYREQGTPTRIICLGPDGFPSANSHGVTETSFELDPYGNHLETRFYGLDGRPRLSADGDVAGYVSTFDKWNHETSRQYFGLDGEPRMHTGGKVSTWRARFDLQGNLTEIRFWDTSGNPVENIEGVSGHKSTFDARGNETSRVVIDTKGEPKMLPGVEGFSKWVARYDDRNRQIEISYLDENEHPRLSPYYMRRNSYDERGNVTTSDFLDKLGHLVSDSHAARVTYAYDKYGRELERRFYDSTGMLSLHPISGRAIVRFERDTWGRVLSESSFDTRLQPVNSRDEGWSQKVYVYSPEGQLLHAQCLTVLGKKLAKCKAD